MKTAIVRKSDLQIVTIYLGSADQSRYGGPWGDPTQHAHVSWDDTAMEHVVAQDDGQGGVELVEDIQATRNSKLKLMRDTRDAKLAEVDIMCNELAVTARADAAAVKVYRQSLLDITNNYKDPENEEQGAESLDALEKDLSDLMWPTKP